METVYKRLAKHLDKLPIPYPATESGLEVKILERWFTEREAEIALAMNGFPETVATIAERLNTDPEVLAPVLESMSRKGAIFRIAKGEKRFYNLVPLAEGMWEFHIHSNTLEDIKTMKSYLEVYMPKAWYGTSTSQHRIIPISESLTDDMEILTYERAEEILRSQTKIAVAPCICRKEEKMLGRGCNHPMEVCMAFGVGAYFYIENGLGREVSQTEAIDILKGAMDSGLVLQPGNGQKAWNMCMCCGCCCNLLKALKKMEKPAAVAHTNFYASVLVDNCTACGLCEEKCPMEAIRVVDDAAVVNRDRCIGCGVCVGTCAFDAVKLLKKDVSDRYIPPKDVIEMQTRVAKERGLF
ncbi:MAG: 4Fe-4S binding protein [Syntrophales bacterium]|jgi:Pyruvate/2-oxoacid:ferredoxin oxidoreductase delta subunit